MYHSNPTVNDICLAIINDGDGSQCGTHYAGRCEAARRGSMSAFLTMAQEYEMWRLRHGMPSVRRAERIAAAEILLAYYCAHNAKSVAS